MTSVGVRQKLWGDRAWVYLSVMDPFNLYRFSFETRDRTHVQTSRNQFSLRRVMLSFSYSFGRPPEQASRRTPTEPQPAEPQPQIH
jgi:hypothetical protein